MVDIGGRIHQWTDNPKAWAKTLIAYSTALPQSNPFRSSLLPITLYNVCAEGYPY
jgi:hypothetical protein